mgnify:FL=1
MTFRRLLTFLFSLAITAIFLGIALYRVDLNQLLSSLATADYRLVALGMVCVFASYLLRTARWQRFLRPTKQIPIPRLFPVLVVGFALNNLLPGRPGELARPYWLGARENISKTLGLATIIVERVADGIALIAFLLIALLAFTPLKIDLPPAAETIALAATILFGVALAGLLFLLVREQLALSIFKFFARFLPHHLAARLEKMLGSFIVGLHSLKSTRDVAAIVILSLSIWLVESTLYFLMLSAFNALPDTADHAVASVFMMVLINLGVMIPAAPGGVGPYEAAAIFALSAFGVDATLAATVALASHAISYIIITGMGLFFIWHAGMSLAQASGDKTEQEIEGA